MTAAIRRDGFLLALGMWALLSGLGCATSLQPLATKEVATDVPGLAGTWVVETSLYGTVKAGAQVKIRRRGVGFYDLQLTQEENESFWNGRTVNLGETVFVDLLPEVDDATTEKPDGILLVPTHVIFVLRATEQQLSLYGFDHRELDPIAVSEGLTAPVDQRLVYIAEPKKLQEFFAKHGVAHQQKQPLLVLKKAG